MTVGALVDRYATPPTDTLFDIALDNPRPEVRLRAVDGLAAVGETDALRRLVQRDVPDDVRIRVTDTLDEL